MGKSRKLSNADYINQKRADIGNYLSSRKSSRIINPVAAIDNQSGFWQSLHRRWQHLSHREKIAWIIIGLLATGLTITAVYQLLPIIIDYLNANHKSPCVGFKKASGEANPKSAAVVLLGENHQYRDETVKCLDTLSDNKAHIVLVEDVPRGKVIPCSEKKITERPGRTCMGWDSPESVKRVYNEILDQNQNDLVKIFLGPDSGFSEAQVKFGISHTMPKLLKELDEAPPTLKRSDNQDSQRRTFTEEENKYLQSRHQYHLFKKILDLLAAGDSKAEIYKKLIKPLKPYVEDMSPSFSEPEMIASLRHRQSSLVHALKEAMSNDTKAEKVFVVSGAVHFFNNFFNIQDRPGAKIIQESFEEIEEHCKGNISGLISTQFKSS